MFTGIVEDTGVVEDISESNEGNGLRIRIGSQDFVGAEDLEVGQSISVSGVCLTIEEFGRDWFEVFLAEETVEKTYLGSVEEGTVLNLERALRADSRLDGHFVQGHVDTTVEITGIEEVGEDWRFSFSLPDDFAIYIVRKGSVTLDGISLTVAELEEDSFEVAIIPETYRITNFSDKEVGDEVNLEVDVVAKYVESMISDLDAY